MANLRVGQPVVHKPLQSFPVHSMSLAATPQRLVPVSTNLVAKQLQSRLVRRHSIVPIESTDHSSEPLSLPRYRLMHSSFQLSLDRFEFPAHCVPDGFADDRKHAVSFLPADVREAQEIECLGSPQSALLAVFGCKRSEFHTRVFWGLSSSPNLPNRWLSSARSFSASVLFCKPTMKSSAHRTTITSPRLWVRLQ
jgi:hypothetical protein